MISALRSYKQKEIVPRGTISFSYRLPNLFPVEQSFSAYTLKTSNASNASNASNYPYLPNFTNNTFTSAGETPGMRDA